MIQYSFLILAIITQVNKKGTSGPAMITKAVGTGDLEIDSSSVSTDSGSPVTDNNGKVCYKYYAL